MSPVSTTVLDMFLIKDFFIENQTLLLHLDQILPRLNESESPGVEPGHVYFNKITIISMMLWIMMVIIINISIYQLLSVYPYNLLFIQVGYYFCIHFTGEEVEV